MKLITCFRVLPCRGLLVHDPFKLLRITTPSAAAKSLGGEGETGEGVLAQEFVLEEMEENSVDCVRVVRVEPLTRPAIGGTKGSP
jgi:hypothetical protein